MADSSSDDERLPALWRERRTRYFCVSLRKRAFVLLFAPAVEEARPRYFGELDTLGALELGAYFEAVDGDEGIQDGVGRLYVREETGFPELLAHRIHAAYRAVTLFVTLLTAHSRSLYLPRMHGKMRRLFVLSAWVRRRHAVILHAAAQARAMACVRIAGHKRRLDTDADKPLSAALARAVLAKVEGAS